MAMQGHRRRDWSASVLLLEDRDGLVWISRLRIALSRSESVVEAPCMAMPPEIETFVFDEGAGAGEEVREPLPLEFRASEIKGPEAEGGGFAAAVVLLRDAVAVAVAVAVVEDVGTGDWIASGFSCRARTLARGGSFPLLLLLLLLLLLVVVVVDREDELDM